MLRKDISFRLRVCEDGQGRRTEQQEQLSQVVHPEHLAQEQLSPMFTVEVGGLTNLKMDCILCGSVKIVGLLVLMSEIKMEYTRKLEVLIPRGGDNQHGIGITGDGGTSGVVPHHQESILNPRSTRAWDSSLILHYFLQEGSRERQPRVKVIALLP